MIPIIFLPLLLGSTDHIESIEVRAAKDLLNSNNFNHAKEDIVTSDMVTSENNTIADWLTSNPSFSLNGQGGLYQSYSVRGLSRWRVRTNINGMPILTDRRAGNSASFIDPALISNVSVLAGPSSMLYGSGAIAGVVSVESGSFHGPTFELGLSDSNNTRSFLAANGNDFGSFAISHRSSNEGTAANGDTIYSAYEQSSASFKIKSNINDNVILQTRWLGSLSKDVQKSSADDFLKKQSIYPEDIHSLADISLSTDTWVLNFFNHYQNWDSQVSRVGKRENITSYQSHTLGSSFYKETSLLSQPTRFGIDWVSRTGVKINEKEISYSNWQIDEKSLIDGSYHNLAAYIQSKFSINQFEFNIGTRIDTIHLKNVERSKSKQYLSGSLSSKYQFNEQHTSVISIGSAFRFPTLTELYFSGVTPRGNTLGNDDLKTENSISYEYSHTINYENLELEGSFFHTTLDNYIERVRIDDNTRSYINLDEAKISGLELSVTYRLGDNSTHAFSYSKQKGENQIGNSLNDISPQKLSLKSRINIDSFEFTTDIFYRTSHQEVGPSEAPLTSLFSANIKADWYYSEEVTVSIGITNLLNKLYRTTADEDAPFANERRAKLSFKWHQF